ncbi:hypothetical protein Tco_1266462 [Tanacetum coccineum]
MERVVRFGKRGKLNPRFVGPFKVIKRVGDVAYKLELPEELSRVHNTFHVSNLKKCHADEPLAVPLDGLHFDDKLQFVEEPIEITDREVKWLKRSRIPLVKVRWNSKRGPEFTWEREDQFRKKYPHLFTKNAPSSNIIRDLKQQRDKLDLAVIDYKRQKEEYQKTQTIFNQTQRDKEEKYLNDILQLQAKNKDLENVVCKMGKSTETLRLLTNEQKAFRDNLRKSGLGYNGPYVLSQAYAKIPKLYRAYELCNKNEQLHVFDSEETLEDAEKSQLKMNEFQKDEKVQELKIKPIDYRKLNKLYDDFVPQKELSAEQTYFPSSFISSEKVSSETKPSMASMPSANPMLVDLNEMENVFKKLFELLEKNCKRESIFYTSKEELRLIDVCVEAKLILREWHVYFEVFQNRFKRDVKEMKDVFVSVENDLDETFKQNELLKDQLLEASLAEDIKNLVITSCVEIRNKDLHDETKRISKESKDVSNESTTADTVCNNAFEVTQELSKSIVELEKDLSNFEAKSIAFEIALQHKSRENTSLKTLQKENKNFMASLQIKNAHLK